MRRFTSILVSFLLAIAVGFGAWRALDRKPPEATWLQVEAPRQADAGLRFPVRVTLRSDKEHSRSAAGTARFVRVDLHGFTRRHEWRDCIVSAPAQSIATSHAPIPPVFEFSLPVPPREDLRYVAIVVYLTRNGEWNERVAAASSLEIWYDSPADASPPAAWERIPMYPQIPGAAIERSDVIAISILTALGWIVCAVCAWRADWRSEAGGRHHRLLPWGALLAAGWELLPLEPTLGALARRLVSALHLYDMRMGFQQAITALLAATAVFFVYRTLRRAETSGLRLQMIGLTVYATVTLTSFLSLHLIDAILAHQVAGVPLLQGIQLAGVALSVVGTVLRSKKPTATSIPG